MLGDLDLHERVRRVGRRPAARRQLQLGHELLLAHAEPPRRLGRRRLPDLRQPAHHGEQPPQPPARLRAGRALGAGRRPGSALLRRGGRTTGFARKDGRRLGQSRSSHATSSSRNDAGSMIVDVVEQPEHPRADGREATTPRAPGRRTRRRRAAPPCPHRPRRSPGAPRAASTRIRMSTASSPSASQGSSGSAAFTSTSTSSGTRALPVSPRDHVALDAVDPERPHGGPLEVPGHQVPVAEAEPQADRRDDAGAPRPGRRTSPWACVRTASNSSTSAAGGTSDAMGRTSPRPGRAQLQQRISTTRIAQVDAGDGEVERDLLVGFEIEVGQVERLTVDQVPVLLVAGQPLGQDRDALVTQQPLVPLEGLAARRVLVRVARDLVRDGVEGQRLLACQQHQHEVGDAFEPIEFRGAPPSPRAYGGRRAVIAAAHPFDWHLHVCLAARLPRPRRRLLLGRPAAHGLGGDGAPEGPLRRRGRRPGGRRHVAAGRPGRPLAAAWRWCSSVCCSPWPCRRCSCSGPRGP